MIESKNIIKKYGQKVVIPNLDLHLPEGKLIAFIGPNGSGKSTLLSMMSRLDKQYSGEIYLDKTEVRSWNSKELAKKLSILKQSNTIQLNITVEELVSFGRFPHSRGKLNSKDKEIINRVIKQMNLEAFTQRSIHQLSGGQLQRVYIAMILAQDTQYILLDEPLNNLDMKHANEIMHILKEIVVKLNKTVIVVLHDINFASGFADYIVALKSGEVFFSGETGMMMEASRLKELYDMDIKIIQFEGKHFCIYFN